MATNTKLLQAMADTMLPLFGDMPRVLLEVRDDPAFHVERAPLAVYAGPNILINPDHPPSSSFNGMKDTVCHELIHAWLDWTGLDRTGEFLDQHHNEWFVKKALEINRLNLDGLNVSVEFLLTTPEAIGIYNRVADATRLPRQPETEPAVKTPTSIKKELLGLFAFRTENYWFKLLIIFSIVFLAVLFFNNAWTGYIWVAGTFALLVWLGFEAWKEIGGRRLARKKTPRKAETAKPAQRNEKQ